MCHHDEIEKKPKSISILLEDVLKIFKDRDWEQFHSPKNLVMNLVTEVGELIEHFRWVTEEESYHLDEKTKHEVKKEIADVFITLTYLASKLNIDPISASFEKLVEIEKKYPIEECQGKSLKYTNYKINKS